MISRLLKPGGVWINEGPLLYYGNPGMELPFVSRSLADLEALDLIPNDSTPGLTDLRM